jgi:bifunctional non-homologous end joining protein LigD
MPPMSNATYLKIGPQVLKLTNLTKVLYPLTNFTKKDMLKYYRRIAPVLLPHLADRPITLKRYPNGVDGEYFYEKRCPHSRPSWVRTELANGIGFCLIEDIASLMWVANLASIEIHPYLCRVPRDDRSTLVAFDLDPGAPASMRECARVAFWLKSRLDELGLKSFPKTSGSKGIQLYVPLNGDGYDFSETKSFSREIAEYLEKRHPEQIVSRMSKALRPGKVLIDWSQNDQHKTTVSVYSLRAVSYPSVSTPITWNELAEIRDGRELRFTPDEVLARVERDGDLFKPVLVLQQELPSAPLRIAI